MPVENTAATVQNGMERTFDPILVEVVKNELAAITEEMAIAVWKTGRSAMVKSGDFAATICDSQGRLIGPGYASPFQLAFFMQLMPYLLNKQGGTFKIDAPVGALLTSGGGRGFRVVGDSNNVVTIDAVADRLVFARQPAGVLSGSPLQTQPIVHAEDRNGFVDLEFTETVTLSTTGTGSLLHNIAVADSGVTTFSLLTRV